MKPAYKVDIRWSEEDGVYIARVPELEGVVTDGDSIAEAAGAAEEAIELHLESLKAHDEAIPEPISLANLNGKYALRMGKDRHEDVVIAAKIEDQSVNEFINDALDARIKIMGGQSIKARILGGAKIVGSQSTRKTKSGAKLKEMLKGRRDPDKALMEKIDHRHLSGNNRPGRGTRKSPKGGQ